VPFYGFFMPMVFWGTSHGEVCDTHSHQMESMFSSTNLIVNTLILKLPSSIIQRCIYCRARPPQCFFKFGIVPKVSVLDNLLTTLDISSKDLTYTRSTYFGTHTTTYHVFYSNTHFTTCLLLL
jgi:hypothetical protein